MASHMFNAAKTRLLDGTIDLNTDDIRVALVMSNTTADSENDAMVTVDDLNTLDEADGANYARKALANEAVATDDANDRAEFDADDVTWANLGAGTRNTVGLIVFKHITDDTDSLLIAYMEFAAPVTQDGSNFTVQWNAEGIIQAA